MNVDYEKLLAAKMGMDVDYVRYIFGRLRNYDSKNLKTLVDSFTVVNSENGLEKEITFVLYDKVHTIHMFRSNPHKVWNATLVVEDSYMLFSSDFFYDKFHGETVYSMSVPMLIYDMDGVNLVNKHAKDAKLPPMHSWDAATAKRNFGLCGINPDHDLSDVMVMVDTPRDDILFHDLGGLLGVIDNNYQYYTGRRRRGGR